MAEFVRAQIFGTTFEITSRSLPLLGEKREGGGMGERWNGGTVVDGEIGTPTCNPWGWEPLAWCGMEIPIPIPIPVDGLAGPQHGRMVEWSRGTSC